jgi:hypothetical protein
MVAWLAALMAKAVCYMPESRSFSAAEARNYWLKPAAADTTVKENSAYRISIWLDVYAATIL